MKKNTFFISLVPLAVFLLVLTSSCKLPCCVLSEPQSLQAIPKPDPKKLTWSPVSGAAGYKVKIKNAGNNSLLLEEDVSVNTFDLPSGIPSGSYIATVQAYCDKNKICRTSSNTNSTYFTVPLIMVIVQDIVVMKDGGGTGLTDCNNCSSSFYQHLGTGDRIDLSSLLQAQGLPNRDIFCFKVHYYGKIKHFKLAFDGPCREEIKMHLCDSNETDLRTVLGNNNIQFIDNSTNVTVLTLTANRNGEIDVNWHDFTSGDTKIEYQDCTGNWTPECPSSTNR